MQKPDKPISETGKPIRRTQKTNLAAKPEKPKKPRKRLTSPLFIDRYRKFLKKGGVIHLKTDSDLLYEYTLEQIREHQYKLIENSNDVYNELILRANPNLKLAMEIKTFYEKMWLKEGKKIKYLCFSID